MNWIKKNQVNLLFIICVIGLICYLFWPKIKKMVHMIKNQNTKQPEDDDTNILSNKLNDKFQKSKTKKSKAVCAFFHMKNCKFCDEMKPEWKKLEKKGSHNGCKFIDVDADNDKIVDNHKVQSFPTIKFCPDGLENPKTCVEHEGERTADAIISFVEKNM